MNVLFFRSEGRPYAAGGVGYYERERVLENSSDSAPYGFTAGLSDGLDRFRPLLAATLRFLT